MTRWWNFEKSVEVLEIRNENVKAYEEDIVVIYLRKIKISYLILDYAEYHKKHKWKKDWKLRKLSMI